MFKPGDKVALLDHNYTRWVNSAAKWKTCSRFGIFKFYDEFEGVVAVYFPDYYPTGTVITDKHCHMLQPEDIVLESVWRSELFQLLNGGKE